MTRAFSTVSARPLHVILEAAARAGVDVDAVLAEAALEPARLEGLSARLTYVEVAAGCSALDARAKHLPLALLALAHLEEGALGMVESLAFACDSLRSTARLMSQLARLVGDGIGFELRDEGRESSFIHVPHPGHPIPPVLAELAMVITVCVARRLMGRELRTTEVRFTHSRPSYASELEAFFGATVTFGASEIAVRFPSIYLDLPLRGHDAITAGLEARARAFMQVLPTEEGLRSRLRAWMAPRLEKEAPELTCAAQDLGLNSRTLQRRLRGFGTSFQHEIDALRRQIVEHGALLAPSVGALASSVGFRDVSAFSRAFRRWTGESPRGFRARRLAT